jgi:tetratricopeptide (TPR) repeat protein
MKLKRIYKPKTGTPAIFPIRAAGEMQTLPLHNLGDKNFERLIARLASVQPEVLEALIYGTNGQEQYGIDVYARLENSQNHRVYQAKCYTEYESAKVVKAVDVFLYKDEKTHSTKRNQNTNPEKKWALKGNTFVLCVSCKLEETQFEQTIKEQRVRLEFFEIDFQLWDETGITDKLRQQPEIVLDFFGLPWVQTICGQHAHDRLNNNLEHIVRIPHETEPAKTPSGYLRSERRTVPFGFRLQEYKEFLRWLNSTTDFQIKVFTGIGGIGKTRFFLEMALLSSQNIGWTAGFVDKNADINDMRRILNRQTPTLLIFDYAESRNQQLEVLIPLLHTAKHPVRVALLARDKGEWLEALLRITNARSVLLEQVIPIKAIAKVNRQRTYEAAFQKFSKILGSTVTEPPTSPNLQHATFERVLAIHMVAMIAVLDNLRNTPEAPSEDLPRILDRLLDHETQLWNYTDTRNLERLRRLMTVATLHGGWTTQSQALKLSEQAPLLENLDADKRETVLNHFQTLYPKDNLFIAPLEPDILGERLVQTELEGKQSIELINLVFGESEPSIAPPSETLETAITVLIRLVQWNPKSSEQILRAVLNNRMNRMALMVFGAMPKQTVQLMQLAADCGEHALKNAKNLLLRAVLLKNLGVRYGALGQHENALTIMLEAVELLRDLAREHLDTFTPDLASSLNNLGNRYSALAQHENALTVTFEAVKLYRVLAQEHPDTFTPSLASSFTNLGVRHSALGQHKNALAAIFEAVELRRVLARERPDAFMPNLADSLINLGDCFNTLGQRENALVITLKAVELYRELAQEQPDAFTPNLASSLNNLGGCYHALGQPESALTAMLEAVELRRVLAQGRPNAFIPDFASSLNNLGVFYSALGQRENALTATLEAVELYQALYSQYGSPFAENYAKALNFLSDRYREQDQTQNALEPAHLAVKILKPVFLQTPKAYQERMFYMVKDYRNLCKILNQEADPDLLYPIDDELQKLNILS